jgi:hypothetical protein
MNETIFKMLKPKIKISDCSPKPMSFRAALDSPKFLKWLRKKSQRKKFIKKIKNIATKHHKKVAFEKLIVYTSKKKKIWRLIKKRFIRQTGEPPPITIKWWFEE